MKRMIDLKMHDTFSFNGGYGPFRIISIEPLSPTRDPSRRFVHVIADGATPYAKYHYGRYNQTISRTVPVYNVNED